MKLQGSEKQINWASDIRSEFIKEGQATLAKVQNSTDEQCRGKKAEVLACINATLALADSQESASWWINGGGIGRTFTMEMRARRAEFGI